MTTTTTNTEKTTTTNTNTKSESKRPKAKHNAVYENLYARKTIGKDIFNKEHNVNNPFNLSVLKQIENGPHNWKLITDTARETASYANKSMKNVNKLNGKCKEGREIATLFGRLIQLIWTSAGQPIDKCPKMTAEVINNFRSRLEQTNYHRTEKEITAKNGTMSIVWKDYTAWVNLGADLVSTTLHNMSWKVEHDNNEKITAREDKDKARKAEKERKAARSNAIATAAANNDGKKKKKSEE